MSLPTTLKLPALRAEVLGAASVKTPRLYPAFPFVPRFAVAADGELGWTFRVRYGNIKRSIRTPKAPANKAAVLSVRLNL